MAPGLGVQPVDRFPEARAAAPHAPAPGQGSQRSLVAQGGEGLDEGLELGRGHLEQEVRVAAEGTADQRQTVPLRQPALVLADTATLRTLPDREYREGFAEVIKHAAIRDAAMVPLIEPAAESCDNLAPLIERNVAIKAAIVEEDEKETSGTRALRSA